MRRSMLLFGLALAGCAHGTSTTVADTSREPSSFVATDRFESLPERLDDMTSDPARAVAQCLVRVRATDLLLTADLAPAISPMPSVTTDAIEAARRSDEVRLVSRWGVDGDLGPYVATFTHHAPPPGELAIVVFVESTTSFVRSTDVDGPRDDGLTDVRLASLLTDAMQLGQPLVVISAPPSIPLGRIERLLSALDRVGAPFAFGVAFVADEPVSDLAPRPDDHAGLCESLPEAGPDAIPGSLSPDSVIGAVRSLDASLRACVSLGDPRVVGRGGRIRVAARISPDGTVGELCATSDTLGEPHVRGCILDAIRALPFPTPSPSGVVDISFPLTFPRSRAADHAAICH